MDTITLAVAKRYTDQSLLGAGAIVGKNVQVSKIEPIIGGNRVTFTYTLDDGTQQNSCLEVMNGEQGISVVSANVSNNGDLSFGLSNGETLQAGTISIDSSKIELDDLITKTIDKNFIAVSSEEINNLFKTEV